MNAPPLAIVQARMGSRRLPGKMMLPIGGVPLIERVWRTTVEAFGAEHVIVAHPDTPENAPMAEHLDRIGARRFAFPGDESDVLGRFWHCAHHRRWHPDSIIVRVTPDDFRKDPDAMRRVANGERLPVELGAEAFTLAMLDAAHARYPAGHLAREHLTLGLFPTAPPEAPEGGWSIDTPEDYERARAA